jgi:hypothetical protein
VLVLLCRPFCCLLPTAWSVHCGCIQEMQCRV